MWGAPFVAVSLGSGIFLVGLAAKERDNRFCVSCHLHEPKFLRLIATPPNDLAGAHYRQKAEVGCIACHGGADTRMRLRVWTVAEVDTLRFLVGAYREPERMRLPLRDAECRQCHMPILRTAPSAAAGLSSATDQSVATSEAETEGRAGTSYHAIREHDTVNVRCVRCHTAHTTDSDGANHFVSKSGVTRVCRDCHKEM